MCEMPAKVPKSAVGATTSTAYIPPTPPGTSPDETSLIDANTYSIDWTSLASPASTSLQVVGKTVDHSFGGSAPTCSPVDLSSVNDPWNTGFGLGESSSTFAYDSVFGASPPITDTDAAPMYLLQSPPSTISSTHRLGDTSANDDHNALMELSKINIDLHARVSAAKANCSHLTFDDLVYRQGPLYIDNYTLTEFILNISQDFLQVIIGLLPASPTADTRISELLSLSHKSKSQSPTQVNQASHSPPSHHAGLPEPLSAPLALMITSIFIQILLLYELILEHTTTRVDRLPIEPIPPIPILPYDSLVLESLCRQGAFFSRTLADFLERMQYVLGIDSGPGAGQKGLLTAKQVKAFWGDLDSERSIVPGQALMGPIVLGRLFVKMEIIFERIAEDSSP
ncbi:hypothetical protein NW752_011639 [Fusarium irregulare]|nr:hypothetical protein NW752_011639 [Fusarium irregulare]